jgi:hypothetical protein
LAVAADALVGRDKKSLQAEVEAWWAEVRPQTYARYQVGWRKRPWEWQLSSRQLGALSSWATGHGDYEEYHLWRRHPEWKDCFCGGRTDPWHAFACRGMEDFGPPSRWWSNEGADFLLEYERRRRMQGGARRRLEDLDPQE